ncbi:MAG: CHC2 zinc finger domain-containing protein [Dehalococcoidia bacterium]|nr:CHC2 zinc finger domain-containing protein [Dehalococcoidia bacterium]
MPTKNRPLITGGLDATPGGRASVSHYITADACGLCGAHHDEIINILVEAEYKRIADDDLAAELAYTERELLDGPGQRAVGLLHRLAVLKGEAQRRRLLAAKGGPLYRGRSSIPPERILELKATVNIGDLIARDLHIAWMRGNRTYFYCPAHGDGDDRNPSLVAYEDQGAWWCFGCNSGGDQIDWLIARHGMSFRQAVEALA